MSALFPSISLIAEKPENQAASEYMEHSSDQGFAVGGVRKSQRGLCGIHLPFCRMSLPNGEVVGTGLHTPEM